KPALNRHAASCHAQIAEGQHRSIGRLRIPRLELHLCRIARCVDRIKALRDHVEDSGVVQIVPQRAIEYIQKFGVLWILVPRLEVGHRQPNLLHAQPSPGLDPVLRRRRNAEDCQRSGKNSNSSPTNRFLIKIKVQDQLPLFITDLSCNRTKTPPKPCWTRSPTAMGRTCRCAVPPSPPTDRATAPRSIAQPTHCSGVRRG